MSSRALDEYSGLLYQCIRALPLCKQIEALDDLYSGLRIREVPVLAGQFKLPYYFEWMEPLESSEGKIYPRLASSLSSEHQKLLSNLRQRVQKENDQRQRAKDITEPVPRLTNEVEARKMATAKFRTGVFVSYSHKDRSWLEKLRTALAPMMRGEKLEVWDDTRIVVKGARRLGPKRQADTHAHPRQIQRTGSRFVTGVCSSEPLAA